MSFRYAPWRRCCPDVVGRTIDEALRATIYIVHEAGPTGFVLKQEGEPKKVKVFLGDQHNCSCALFRKKREVCLHILWILLKKFRVPRENPVIWQLGLIEREINEVLLGHLRKQSPVHSSSSGKKHPSGKDTTIQRDIGLDDVCPICQDELLNSASQRALTFCKYSCGKSVHLKCMKIWAEHQKSTTGESIVRCPLCRENFGPITEMPSKSPRRVRAERSFLHLGVACMHCHVCPIAGKCYRCVQCASYYLCHACFSSNQVHVLHSFEVRQHCNQPWREADRPLARGEGTSIPPSDSPALPPALINSLQSRSLTENDYEILLQLDNSNVSNSASVSASGSAVTPPTGRGGVASQSRGGGSRGGRSVPERVINSFHVEPLDGNHPLVAGRDSCQICYSVYSRGDWIRKLPCKHKFHRECIDEWLRSNHITCPIDDQPVYDPAHHRQCTAAGTGRLLPLRTQQRRRRSTARSNNRSGQLAPLSQTAAQQSRLMENGGSSSSRGTASDLASEEWAEFSISGQGIIGGGGGRGGGAVATSKKNAKKNASGLRRGISSSHPSLKKSPLTGKATTTFLPKLDQHCSINVTHISAQSAKQATAENVQLLSLPKINSSTRTTTLLGQNPSDSDIRFKRLTIQIPSGSGGSTSAYVPQSISSVREKLPMASRTHSTSSSGLISKKSRNRGLTERMSDHSLLAPICNSYSTSAVVMDQPTEQRTDEQLIEGSPHKIESAKVDSMGVHGDDDGNGMIFAVMPATDNLSSSRFSELKQTSGVPSMHPLPLPPTSMGGAKRSRRGSLAMPPMKRCFSLRESASGLLDSSLQVSTFKLSPPAAQEHNVIPSSSAIHGHSTLT